MRCKIINDFHVNVPEEAQIGDTYALQAIVCVTSTGAEIVEVTSYGQPDPRYVLGERTYAFLATSAELRNKGAV